MTDINLCTPAHEEQNEEIAICPAGDQEKTIIVCPDDCANASELFLTGTDEPAVNDQYSASGGVGPYTYTFTGGTIDSTGKVTSVTSCGGPDGNGAVASVSATDSCGTTARIEVRLPGGYWVFTSQDCAPREPDCSTPWPGCGSSRTCTYTSGGSQYTEYWRNDAGCISRYCSNSSASEWLAKKCDAVPCSPQGYNGFCYCLYMIRHFTWQC